MAGFYCWGRVCLLTDKCTCLLGLEAIAERIQKDVGKVVKNVRRCGKIVKDMGRCWETVKNVGICGERIWEDAGNMWEEVENFVKNTGMKNVGEREECGKFFKIWEDVGKV